MPERSPRCADTPAALRERAAHARRLALGLVGDPAAERLNNFADELEERAAALEREASGDGGALPE
jgi:hypothetical protein